MDLIQHLDNVHICLLENGLTEPTEVKQRNFASKPEQPLEMQY